MASAREFDINLIEGRSALPRSGGRTLLLTLLVGVLVALLVIIAGWLLLDRRLETVKTNLKKAEAGERVRQQEVDMLLDSNLALSDLTRQVAAGEQILKNVPHWPALLERLERATMSQITVESLAADRLGTVRLSGESASLPLLTDQVRLWRQQSFIKAVELGGITRDTGEQSLGGYRFSATFEITPTSLYGG